MSPKPPERGDPYLGAQLIPYLGNKRALLPHLWRAFNELAEEFGPARSGPYRFLDAFAGSGSVSRLAKRLGFKVAANDWEPYSKAINECWLAMGPEDLKSAFPRGVEAAFEAWNRMHPGHPAHDGASFGQPYLARWYAPESTEAPQLGRERLFYTAENARFIDSGRNRLDQEYPNPEPGSPAYHARTALLGAILLEAAVHSNTSGVFKAYHRGFGGHGKDALGRIMARMELEVPMLAEGPAVELGSMDAAAFLSGRSADIAYLDPPYNQHQYGSNYHLLNTICLWDRPPMPLELGPDGNLARKAGIPEGWRATSSAFCSRPSAKAALQSALDAADARTIVLSWNGEGFLSDGELVALLADRGAIEARALSYLQYRGGRQSEARANPNNEFLFIVRCDQAPSGAEAALEDLRRSSALNRAASSSYAPERLRRSFVVEGAALRFRSEGAVSVLLPLLDERRLAPDAVPVMNALGRDAWRELSAALESARCRSASEEIDSLLTLLAGEAAGPLRRGRAMYTREALRQVRKLAHPRYAKDFYRYLEKLEALADDSYPASFSAGLSELRELAVKRAIRREA